MNEREQLLHNYRDAVYLFRGAHPAQSAQRAAYAHRAASIALIISFSGDEPLDVWQEVSTKWLSAARTQEEQLPLALAQ